MAQHRPIIHTVAARNRRVSKGFYVARRLTWPAEASWTVIMVVPDLDGDDGEFVVYEPGVPRPSPVSLWMVRDRILGLKEAGNHYAEIRLGQVEASARRSGLMCAV